MAEMILRKIGVVLLTILKGLLQEALLILKLLFGKLRNQYPEWYGTYEVWKCGNSF